MSSYTIQPSLARISKERLSSLLLTQPTDEKVVVVDVRDSDHIGGHIKASRHVPSGSLNYTLPELARTLKGAERVVFHCALSQERGPAAAQKYIRERERLFGAGSVDRQAVWGEDGDTEVTKKRDETGAVKKQDVFVLEGGFVEWQQKWVLPIGCAEDGSNCLWQVWRR